MSSPQNRRRRKHTDCISILPDTVLCLVLSFLSTKSVVKTSILSKRWRYIWMKVPALDFTDTDKPDYYKHRQLSLEQTICFKSFVDKVLLHNNVSYVQRFCLNLHDVDEIYVNSWLTAAASRKIHELSISLYQTSRVHISLPPGLLSGEKLRVLKLEGKIIMSTLMFAHLPNLETIELQYVKFPDDGFMKRLLSSCLVLKELHIIGCDGIPENLYIESSTLKSMKIKWCCDGSTCFHVKTPNLRYLSLHGTLSQFNIGDMCSLIEADLNVSFEDEVNCQRQAEQLLRKVSGVKSLHLGHKFLQANINAEKLPLFQNLTFLECEADADMCELLQSAPNLKSLVLFDVDYGYVFDTAFAPKHLPCLETVKIILPFDDDEEVRLVAYFLKAASALKEMEIKISYSSRDCEIDFYKKLLSLPRSSAVCQVNVV